MLHEDWPLIGSGSDGRLMLLAHGWCTQVSRYAEAVVCLTNAGLSAECHPITRAALEYAVTLHWVVQRGDRAVGAVLAEYERGVSLARSDSEGGTFESPLSALSADLSTVGMPSAPDELAVLRRFGNICEELNAGDLYVMYRVESWYAHPRWSTVALYIGEADGETVALQEPKEDHADAAIGSVAYSLVLSAQALDRVLQDHPLAERLALVSARLGMSALAPTVPGTLSP